MAQTARNSFATDRLVRTFLLDRSLFREVAANPYGTTEAGAIVLVTSALYAIGHLRLGIEMAAAQFPAALVLWAASFGIAYYLGTEVAPGLHGTKALRVFRALAYANVPRALALLLIIPFGAIWVGLVVIGLTLATYTVALMETMDLDLRSSASIALAANLAPVISFAVAILILL